MPEPILNPDLDEPISTGGGSKKGKGGGGGDYSLSTTLHGNARIVGDQRVQGNNHIDKSCVVRQNIYCAKALEASAYTIRASSYGDPEDPQYDPEHKYTTNIVAGFVTNDEDGNLCFGQPGDGSAGGVTALDQLTDVTLTTPADREYLCFDNISSQWINAAIPFDDLSDVVITSPVDGQSVVFDGGSSTWINQALNDEFIQLSDTPADYSGSAKKFVRINDTNDGLDFSNIKGSDMSDVELGDLSDVDLKLLNTPSIGDHLEFDGTDWVPGAAAAGASFLGHTDTPSDYTGAGAFFVKVNAGATALEFVATVPIDLDDLTDITLSGVANCDFLQFDTGSGQWENKQDVSFAGTLQFKEAKATGPVTFLDSFGNILLQMAPKNTASVNHLRIFSNATGGNVEVFATGADADVNLRLRAKGPNSKVIISRDVDTSGNICARYHRR